MNALDQSFADLCAKHDLINAGVTFHAPSDTSDAMHFSVSLQWGERGRDPMHRGCVIEHGTTVAEALGKALKVMTNERITAGPVLLTDEPLPMGEAA